MPPKCTLRRNILVGAQKLGYKMKKAGFRATNECSLQESGESIEGLGLLEQQE